MAKDVIELLRIMFGMSMAWKTGDQLHAVKDSGKVIHHAISSCLLLLLLIKLTQALFLTCVVKKILSNKNYLIQVKFLSSQQHPFFT